MLLNEFDIMQIPFIYNENNNNIIIIINKRNANGVMSFSFSLIF